MIILEALRQTTTSIKTWVERNFLKKDELNTTVQIIPQNFTDEQKSQARENIGVENGSIKHNWDGTVLSITTGSGTSSADLIGPRGTQGEDGKSAYELACENDFEGPLAEWLSSLKGETGEQGPQGIQGEKGRDGYTPVKGNDYWTEEDKSEIKSYIKEEIDKIIPALPTVTTADNGKVLMVVNGEWAVINLNLAVDENGTISI